LVSPSGAVFGVLFYDTDLLLFLLTDLFDFLLTDFTDYFYDFTEGALLDFYEGDFYDTAFSDTLSFLSFSSVSIGVITGFGVSSFFLPINVPNLAKILGFGELSVGVGLLGGV